MATSNTPKVSSISEFKKSGIALELPSGFVVKVRNTGGLRTFMSNGSIPNNLLAIISKALNTGKGVDTKDLVTQEGVLDTKLLNEMSEMIDNIAMKTIVDPVINPVPADEEERSDDLLYVDELPEDDKMFIYSWVSGGTRDLEQFRRESASGMDAVQSQLLNPQGS